MTEPDLTSPAPAEPALATHRERYGLLLGAIIVAFAIQGIAEPGKIEEILVAVLLGATLLLALWVADAKPRVMGVAVLIVLGEPGPMEAPGRVRGATVEGTLLISRTETGCQLIEASVLST